MTIQKTDRFEDGYLTVFLSLILTVMISLSLMLILGARENTRRMAIECVTDIGMDSILAEYHRELLKQYDLFFIDTSYGTNEADYAKTEKHLLQYVQKNLGSEDLFLPFLYSDPLRLQAQDAVFTQASDAADMGGAVLRRQAVNVMYQRYGVAYLKQLENWMSDIKEYDLDTADVMSRQKQAWAELETWNGRSVVVDGKEQLLQVENPVAGVSGFWDSGILDSIVGSMGNLSTARVPAGSLLSERNLLSGTGLAAGEEFEDNWWQQLIFHEYVMAYTGHYGEEKEDGHLKYQAEYIIAGQNNDLKNLEMVVTAIFGIRAAANLLYLLSDTEKVEMTKALAGALAALLTQPELEPLFQTLLILTWALAESLYDVRVILEGGRIPLLKTAGDWHYSLEEILNFGGIKDVPQEKSGLSYGDYLRLLLMFQDKETTTYRLMDIMEMDIRKTAGNQYFRMDGCIDSLTAVISYTAADGKEYTITRSCGY